MKLLYYFGLISLISLGCSGNQEPEKTIESSVDTTQHAGQQFYPSGQPKITGKLNDKGLRVGIWTSYFENGKKNSESVYKEGVNHGYTMVWYPNGNVRYFGDYTDGKRSGSWTFYNEKGEVVRTESY